MKPRPKNLKSTRQINQARNPEVPEYRTDLRLQRRSNILTPPQGIHLPLDVAVPEALRRHAEVGADHLEVLAAEQVDVVLCEDLEELLELDVLAAGCLGLRQGDLGTVEVHGRDAGPFDQVVEGIASWQGVSLRPDIVGVICVLPADAMVMT
eukprot:749737-Hanusia_phi.AAC.3